MNTPELLARISLALGIGGGVVYGARALEAQVQKDMTAALSGNRAQITQAPPVIEVENIPTPESKKRVLLSEGQTDGVDYQYFKVGDNAWDIHVRIADLDVNPDNPTALGMFYFFEDETGGAGPIRLISPDGIFDATHRVEKPLLGVEINGGGQPECKGAVMINIPQGAILNTLECTP